MSASDAVRTYIPLSAVFPDIRPDFETFLSLLEGLSRTDTVFWCARLNLLVWGSATEGLSSRQRQAMAHFLSPEEIARADRYERQRGSGQPPTVFARPNLLELLRWACRFCRDHENDGSTFCDPETRRRFVQALLIVGEAPLSAAWALQRVEGDRRAELEANLGVARRLAEESSSCANATTCLGRGWEIFHEFLPREVAGLLETFGGKTGLTVDEYYACLALLQHYYSQNPVDSPLFSTVARDNDLTRPEVFAQFCDLEGQSVGELAARLWRGQTGPIRSFGDAPAYAYRPLRERPILCSRDGRAVVADPVFFGEKALQGPLFHLLRGANAQELTGHFGDAAEGYALGVLRRMFPESRCGLAQRLFCNLKDLGRTDLEIDACLNDVTEAVIFEAKAKFLPEASVLDGRPDAYLRQFRSKYVEKEGVGQLAAIISTIAAGQWVSPRCDFGHLGVIYPVLLTYDPLMSAPLHTEYLALALEEALEPDERTRGGNMRRGSVLVAPLIVMTLSDLEAVETSVGCFSLTRLLSDYSQAHPTRGVSLRNYWAASPQYATQTYQSNHLRAKHAELLRVAERLFGTG